MSHYMSTHKISFYSFIAVVFSLSVQSALAEDNMNLPYLRTQGIAKQLVVDGKPFLALGGELGNSSASDLNYMKPVWPTLKTMHLNTVLVPVYWELCEPIEGEYDFALLDSLIYDARCHNLRHIREIDGAHHTVIMIQVENEIGII